MIRSFYVRAVFSGALLLSFQATGWAQSPMQCVANAGVPPIVRAEGLAEPLGDLTLICAGGTPTPASQAVPQYNLTVLLSTNVTSRLLAANQFSEALLVIDEAYSAVNPSRPILNCGNTGAADSGSPGAGVCSIMSTGASNTNYDGTPNGWGTGALCDGSGGRPAANSYGCGRPNVFQGRLGTPSNSSTLNAITFFNVPIDPPGDAGFRTLRITNLRGNGFSVGPPPIGQSVNSITVVVSIQGSPSIAINNPQQLVAYVERGLGVGTADCQGTATAGRLRVCEATFSALWRAKNISSYVGDHSGTAGNATLSPGQSYASYNGGTNYPMDVAQNVPGAIYNIETFFEWQNNGANGPPVPNPPDGIGTAKVTATGFPFASAATGISQAGVADSGTRIAVVFQGIPQGASLQVPNVLYLFRRGASYNGDPTNPSGGATGVMIRTSTDAAGAGVYSPASGALTSATSMAVYEILWADPFSLEFTEVPYTLSNAPPGTTLQVSARLAPFYTGVGAGQASSSLPIPRFADASCPAGSCLSISPNTGPNVGPPVQVTLTSSTGGPNLVGAQVKLSASNLPDIPGTGLSNPNAATLMATVNLAGAPPGLRNVVITPQSGTSVTVGDAFTVLGVPNCQYGVSLSILPFTADGGAGSILVSPNPSTCAWSASTSADWITLPPAVQLSPTSWSQPVSVAPNLSTDFRSSSISIAGQIQNIVQYGIQNCTYTVSPPVATAPLDGGFVEFTVTASSGCGWSESHQLPWIIETNGPAGTVTYHVSSNPGAARTGTVSIAGQTVRISQAGHPSNVGIYRSGLWQMDVNGTGALESGPDRSFFLGFPGAVQFTGDWNGDGRTKAGVYSNGYWFLDYDGNGVWDGGIVDKQIAWGWAGVTPVVGDWNGDGKTKIGVYSNGFWFLDYSGDYQWDGGIVDKQVGWGWAGTMPIVGDWNGDGKTKIGVYINGFWFLDYDGNYFWDGGVVDKQVGWGWAGVTPIVGDWNGDGRTKIGVYSGGYWYLDYDGNYLWEYPAKDQVWSLGWAGTTPVMGDWNGDGKTKAGAFINGFWYLDYNGNGVFDGSGTDRIYAFGLAGDTPVAGHW